MAECLYGYPWVGALRCGYLLEMGLGLGKVWVKAQAWAQVQALVLVVG